VSSFAAYWLSGGPLMWPLAALSIAIWYWMIALNMRLRSAGRLEDSHGLIHDLAARRAVSPREAGPMRRIVEYALAAGRSASSVRDRAFEAMAAEVGPLERELGAFKAMVAAAPLLGLLGTVIGMVSTFSALAERGTASTTDLSEGISQALITTQVGLAVALPGVFGAAWARSRVEAMRLSVERLVAHLAAREGKRQEVAP